MQKIEIEINDIEPRPQERPRFARRGSFMVAYETKAMKDYKKLLKYRVGLELKERYNNFVIFSKAIKVSMEFLCLPPDTWSNKKKSKAYTGEIQKTTKPDIDNYVKAVMDAMNGYLWTDDNLICEIKAKKLYAIRNGINIAVEEIELI